MNDSSMDILGGFGPCSIIDICRDLRGSIHVSKDFHNDYLLNVSEDIELYGPGLHK